MKFLFSLYFRMNVVNDVYTSLAAYEEDVHLCFENSKSFCKGRFPIVFKVQMISVFFHTICSTLVIAALS